MSSCSIKRILVAVVAIFSLLFVQLDASSYTCSDTTGMASPIDTASSLSISANGQNTI